jgi:hypothetical protein
MRFLSSVALEKAEKLKFAANCSAAEGIDYSRSGMTIGVKGKRRMATASLEMGR